MILQIHSARGNIRTFGCYYFSAAFLVSKHAGLMFEVSDLERLYDDAVARGIMSETCYVEQPGGLFSLLGLPARYTNTHEPPNRVCRPGEIEILCWERPRPEKGPTGRWRHFTAGDGQGHVTYDPMGRARTVLEGKLVSKRIFSIISKVSEA